MKPPIELIVALNEARRPVLAGHVSPDVDALGAMLGLARAMPSPDAAVTVGDEPVAAKLQFMFELADVPMADAARVAEADLAIVLDTAGPKRVNVAGGWDAIAEKSVVNIDHHISNPGFGRFNWVERDASSTCELVYDLITAAGWPLDGATASLLYAGIHADTCGFSLPTATVGAFEVSAALARAGADIEQIGACLYRSQPLREFALLRAVYHNTRLTSNGRIAYSTLTLDEIRSTGCTPADIDNQVSIPRSLRGIRIAMLLTEAEPGVVRVNLRGENGTPVLPIAQELGGGGHAYSAGVRVRGPIDQVVQRVLATALVHLDRS